MQFYVQIHLFICVSLELSLAFYDLTIILFPLAESHVFLLRQQAVTTAKIPSFASVYESACACVCVLQNGCVLHEHSNQIAKYSSFQIFAVILCDGNVNSA